MNEKEKNPLNEEIASQIAKQRHTRTKVSEDEDKDTGSTFAKVTSFAMVLSIIVGLLFTLWQVFQG